MHNPWNKDRTFTHVKNFSYKTTRKTRSEHCKTLTQKAKGVACKPSTVCTLTRYRMPVAEPWRGVAVSATREHTHTHEYSHSYPTHIHHTNTTYQTKSNLSWNTWNQLISAWHFWFSYWWLTKLCIWNVTMCSLGRYVPTFQGMYCLQPYNICRLHSRQQVSPTHCYKFNKLECVTPEQHKLYAYQATHNKKIYPSILYTN